MSPPHPRGPAKPKKTKEKEKKQQQQQGCQIHYSHQLSPNVYLFSLILQMLKYVPIITLLQTAKQAQFKKKKIEG